MSQFGPLNRILIPVFRAPSSVPLQLFLTLPFSRRSSMDAITEKLFPILATPPHAAARLPSVFLSSVFISLVHYGKCDMAEEGSWTTAGEEEKCHVAVASWHASKFGWRRSSRLFLAAAAWIVFAFGRQNRMEIRNPLNERRTESSECTRSASGPPPPPPPRKHMSAVCPPFHWRERDRNKRGKGEEGPPACFR